MSKITQYPQATAFDSGDFLIKDGVNGTKIIAIEDAIEDISDKSGLTDLVSDCTELSGDVSNLKTIIGDCQNELGLGVLGYVLPDGYKTASYENSAHTRGFLFADGKLKIYIYNTSTGSVSASEVTTSSASLTIGDTIAYKIASGEDNLHLKLTAEDTFAESAIAAMPLRFYKDDYSSNKTVNYLLETGDIDIDIIALVEQNNVDLATYPNLIIRGIGYVTHTATSSETLRVEIDGFYKNSDKLSDKVKQNTEDISDLNADIVGINEDIEDLRSEISSNVSTSSTAGNVFQFKPFYAHLFINTVSDAEEDTYVPSQSVYDIEISKRLGFNVIEANTHILTDGVSLVTHGTNNKFGAEFAAVSGSSYTDAQIQDTDIASVNYEWVRTNVRYKAKFPKMRVTPPTLEEFLYACRVNNMIPLINYKNIGQVAICDKIMGKDNYIMYGAGKAVRAISGCVIATWQNLTTKQDIYDWVDGIGKPCIVGTTHYDNFSLSDWKEIVETVHQKGGLMGYGYMTPQQEQDLRSVGFDLSGTLYTINPCESGVGNIVNISADDGFDNFIVTDGAESNAQLTMQANGTIIPDINSSNEYLVGMWLDVTFTGSISVKMGRFILHSNSVISSEKPTTAHFSTYAINDSPTFEIKAQSAGTLIDNIVFKSSKL